MPVMIFNNQFGSCYHILGKTFEMWMWQGCNASCRDQELVFFSVTVIVKDGRKNTAYDYLYILFCYFCSSFIIVDSGEITEIIIIVVVVVAGAWVCVFCTIP